MLVLQARFAWWRAGTVNASQDGSTLNFAPYGRSAFALKVFGAATNIPLRLTQGMAYCPTPANTSQACIAFALDPSHAPVTFSTNPSASHDSVSTLLQSNRAATIDGLAKYGEYSWAAASVQAAVGWNFVFHPSEMGPHLPVSPSWAGGRVAPTDDFAEGGAFGWDCIFASYLASLGSRQMAYSSLITIVKAKTSNGFVPNCATAGSKSEDRTEPNGGAKVLLELYRKWGDRWLVELLFDDLLDTNNWFMRERTLAPLQLISLGTSTESFSRVGGDGTPYSCDRKDQNTGCMQAMQASRYESGQVARDFSPSPPSSSLLPSCNQQCLRCLVVWVLFLPILCFEFSHR